MIKKFNNLIQKTRNRPEKDKIKIVWFLSIFCLVIIIGIWLINFNKKNFNNNKNTTIPKLPNFEKELAQINNTINNYESTLNNFTTKEDQLKADIIINKYIKENNLFKESEIENLKLENLKKSKDKWLVEYKQYYNNIMISQSKIFFAIDPQKEKVVDFNSNFNPDIQIDTSPEITENKALDIISKNIGDKNLEIISSQLIIYKDISEKLPTYYLTWKINIVSPSWEKNYYYFINAKNGKIISYYS